MCPRLLALTYLVNPDLLKLGEAYVEGTYQDRWAALRDVSKWRKSSRARASSAQAVRISINHSARQEGIEYHRRFMTSTGCVLTR